MAAQHMKDINSTQKLYTVIQYDRKVELKTDFSLKPG